MRRLSAVAVLGLATASSWSSAAAEPRATPGNSLVAALVLRDSIRIDGVGCGVPATATLALPAGAFDVQVNRPMVGARDVDAQLTAVSAQGSAVSFTAVADSTRVCDAGAQITPPADRAWSVGFAVMAGFKKRVRVGLWDSGQPRAKRFTVRPRQVRIGLFGAARNIRWQRFGGREAVGFGTFRSLVACAGGCTDNGTRLTVKLTRPGYCPGESRPGEKEDAVFYNKVAFVLRERLGVLKRGTEWASAKQIPTCATTGRPPVPVR
jgi:hypothetical protein